MEKVNEKSKLDLELLKRMTGLMDSVFRIPGTNFRIGLDPIIGLIPGYGDAAGYGVSGLMLLIMARHGASGRLLLKMAFNIMVDFVVGAVPFLGGLFDFAFKANTKNLKLFMEHYDEGKHRGTAWPAIIAILSVMMIFLILLLWATWKLTVYLFDSI